jgi:hypothetical protein
MNPLSGRAEDGFPEFLVRDDRGQFVGVRMSPDGKEMGRLGGRSNRLESHRRFRSWRAGRETISITAAGGCS